MKIGYIVAGIIAVAALGYSQFENSRTISNLQNKIEYIEDKTSYTSTIKDFYIENSVYRTNTGTKYHREGCRYLKTSCTEISLDQAISMGLTPCKVCKP